MKRCIPIALALALITPCALADDVLIEPGEPDRGSPVPPQVGVAIGEKVFPFVPPRGQFAPGADAPPVVVAQLVQANGEEAKPPMPSEPDEPDTGVVVPAGPGAAEAEELSVIVKLRDGTIIVGQPVTAEFPIETPFGKLVIPAAEVRSASFGLRVSGEIRKAADAAIAMLSSDDFKERSAGQERLEAMGELGVSAIAAALEKGGLDPETLTRLKKIGKQVAPEGFDAILLDGVNARALRAFGRSGLDTVDVDSSLGRLAIPIDKVEELRAMGSRSFQEDFESFRGDRAGWEFASNGDTVWHVSSERAGGGKKCLRCSVRDAINYSDDAQAVVTSPPIDISNVDQAVMAFSFMLRMEDGSDFCYLELSKNDGKTWGGAINFSSNGAWGQRKINLSEYRSEEFRFRFVFRSDGSNTDMGMHIDDISVGDREML